MSLRSRLLLAFAAVVLVPLVLLGLALRHQMTSRLTEAYEAQVARVRRLVVDDLTAQADGIDRRLASLARAIAQDNRFRAGAVAGVAGERDYVLDYGEHALQLAGLSMLQILDDAGVVISSGHFRNEHGRTQGGLGAALRRRDGPSLLVVDSPEGPFTVLARAADLSLGGRRFVIVGGVTLDENLLRRFAFEDDVQLALKLPADLAAPAAGSAADGTANAAEPAAVTMDIPLVRVVGDGVANDSAALTLRQSRATLAELQRETDTLVVAVGAGAAAAAFLLAAWLSSRVSRPIAALVDKTAVLDLDRLDVQFEERSDEVGALSRVLSDLSARLRTSTARVRDAERRATVGELARQVNHDVRNGLIPIRNVVRHLTDVGQNDPGRLAAVLSERRHTLESSISYLETLATNYERLSQRPGRRACDVNAIVENVVRGTAGHQAAELETRLAPQLPLVSADPVALRRIVENLVANAIESLRGRAGRVVVSTELAADADRGRLVRMTVADTGCGMTPDEATRVFEDFYTTKERGTGLGLSIVRRLVMDLQGTIRVETAPGKGTRMIVDVPAIATNH